MDPTPGFELASVTVDRTSPTRAGARDAADAQNAFGYDLYQRMLRDEPLGLADRGVVMSPTSVLTALALARAGARGDTADELDALLGMTGWDAYASDLGALDQALRSRDATWGDPRYEQHALALRMANMAFGQRGYSIEPAYLEQIGEAFGAPLGLVDYEDDPSGALEAINGWVERQTMGRIPRLLSEDNITSATRLMLVNAVYLKAEWDRSFKGSTRDRPFTTMAGRQLDVPTMHHVWEALPAASGSGWQATELPYLGPEGAPTLSMTLILPDDIDAFERSLGPSRIRAIDRQLADEWDRVTDVRSANPDRGEMDCGRVPYVTDLFVPRFGINTRGDLVPALRSAGMELAASSDADFSGITGGRDLQIAAVIHQANIDVDEKGTEAAAATAVGMDTTGGCGGPEPDETRTLRFNRPFVFLLRDRQTGAILFMGRVADPTER